MANKKITELMAGTPTRDSLLESATDVGGTTVSRKFEVGAVVDLNNVQIASEYDDTATYAYGAYCIKDGVLYRCTTAISVAEAWTSAHWTAVMVTGEYKRVRIMTKAQFDLLSNDEKDGFIYVSDYPTKIQDIDNVDVTGITNGDWLIYNSSTQKFEAGSSYPIESLTTLTDTSISSKQNNDVLRYNSSNYMWVNTPLGFKVQEFTKSYTVNANSSLSFSNDFITIPTGYKMFAMLGYSTNDVNVFVPSCRPWDNGSYAFQLMNVRNTSVSNTFYVRIAFVSDNWL